MSTSNTIKRVRATMLASSVALVGLAATSQAASAAHIQSNSGGANYRSQPDASSYSFAWRPNGTGLSVHCYTDGSWAQGNYWTNRWFKVARPDFPGTIAYMHASLVANQPSVGRC